MKHAYDRDDPSFAPAEDFIMRSSLCRWEPLTDDPLKAAELSRFKRGK
jgi:hypothetical protein